MTASSPSPDFPPPRSASGTCALQLGFLREAFLLFDFGSCLPQVGLPFGFFFANAVPLLKLADQLVPLASNQLQIVIRKFSPLLLHGTLQLFPFPFKLIRVHIFPFR